VSPATRARAVAAAVSVSTLLVGLALFRWAHGPVRGLLGDVLVIVFLVAGLAAAGLGTARSRLVAVGVVALGTELFQGLHLVPRDAPWWVHLTVGSTFDPVDFAAYAVGLALAALAERSWGPTRDLRAAG
jgi:hypothetical protein